MEFKVIVLSCANTPDARINRNIMEFKGEQDRSCLGKYKELIET